MGFAASVARVQMLTARKHDLNFQVQLLSEMVQRLGYESIRNQFDGVDPFNPAKMQENSKRQASLRTMEKNFAMRLELLKAQEQAVLKEIEAVEKVITEEIKTFKLVGGNG